MKKSITKKAKRPKSVLKKAWETRRKNAAHRALPEAEMNRLLYGDTETSSDLMKQVAPMLKSPPGLASLAQGTQQTSQTATLRSEANGINPEYNPAAEIAHVLDLHRTEQLCAFLGDISALRQNGQMKGHYPIMVSRTQINAVEDFLRDHGYGPWGKGSGSLMSVSTKPTAI